MAELDAIVVLGCRLRDDGSPTPALRRRVALGARAFHAGMAPWVVASGGRSWGHELEAVAMGRLLVASGVPDERVLLELRSFTTLENARYTAALLRDRGARRVLLASCYWHLPRAARAFRHAGLEPEEPPRAWFAEREIAAGTWLRERVLAWSDALRARLSEAP